MEIQYLAFSLNKKIDEFHEKKCGKCNDLPEHILRRIVAIALMIPLVGAASIVGAVIGTLSAAGSLLTFGYSNKLNEITQDNLKNFAALPSQIYRTALYTLNPNAKFERFSYDSGVIVYQTLSKLNDIQEDLAESNSILKRELFSRVIALVEIPTAIVARVLDLAIGIFSLIPSLVTLGCFKKLNQFTYRQLQVLQVIPDLHRAVIKLFNPSASASEPADCTKFE